MAMEKRYNPEMSETELVSRWQAEEIYHYHPDDSGPLYSIDSPPATVSGRLHLGHVYSYSHADFFARYKRMRGFNVFYPMGFDDNGLATERLVEKRLGIRPAKVGREAFIQQCLRVSEESEREYREIWQRLGLSVDWRWSYRTIDTYSQRCSQFSFLDLYRKGLVYRSQAPTIWCPECQTAIAQAELEDRERETEFITLAFALPDGSHLPIATTRPELLGACVAVFIHPRDLRYAHLLGCEVIVPLYGQRVPVVADTAADPEKGTGAVMCCTFGDQADVSWWFTHHLPLKELVDAEGRLSALAGKIADMSVAEGRKQIKSILAAQDLILDRQPVQQSIRVHERCDTPVEFLVTRQWFVKLLEHKTTFLELGEQVRWHPEHMHARYQAWVENLSWDWIISRQRTFGVPFPVWYCRACGEALLARPEELPVNPMSKQPNRPCGCGSTDFAPETDVMDTWATSSVSPQIVTGWLEDPDRFAKLFPLTIRPLAHEIIRNWVFYSIVKSWYHFGCLPWSEVLVSGWGIAGAGMGKISKSKGGGPVPPLEMMRRYSADAVRYWAASTSPGKDAVISEEKIQKGTRLATKLWNVARFAEPFISEAGPAESAVFTPADRWIMTGCRALIERVTAAFEAYEYAAAKADVENFFWHNLADNYLEIAKQRLYDRSHPKHTGAAFTLRLVLSALLKLLAPLLPYVTEAIWGELYAQADEQPSIHRSSWPDSTEFPAQADQSGTAHSALEVGDLLVEIAIAVRRYKSEHALSLGTELELLQLSAADSDVANCLRAATADLISVTRARALEVSERLDDRLISLGWVGEKVEIGIQVAIINEKT